MVYKYIRSVKKSSSIPSSVLYNGAPATDSADKASLFNEYFFSVFTSSDFVLPPYPDKIDPSVRCHLVSIQISEQEVYEALVSLHTDKATGIDGIGPRILKQYANILAKPLHHLFTISLNSCSIPYEWRIHTIVPVHKSGDKTQVTNYRPISLLCITSKVLEQLVYNKTISYISSFLSPQQFGFLKNRSTVQQLLLMLNTIHSTNDQTDVVYLDFKKAFDSVPHKELLFKLRSLGISGKLWSWFESYLLNRYQCVKINNSLSHLLPVLSGIPQGSILGPLLFLIYVNDIPDIIKFCLLFLFADDTKCIKTISSPLDSLKLQEDLNNLNFWSTHWNLLFGLSKIFLLSFKRKSPTSYNIGTSQISCVDTYKDLGIMLSSDLSWDAHYNHIISKSYQVLGLLRRSFSLQNYVQAKSRLYTSLVRSQFFYCSVIWKPHLIKHIQQLERVQRRATKYILNDYSTDYKSRLINLHMLPLMYILDVNDVMFFLKNLHNPHNGFDINNFIKFATGHTRLASGNKLLQTRSPDNSTSNFYFNRLPRIWNALPIINYQDNPLKIKAKLLDYLWNHFTANFTSNNTCSFSFLCPCSKCSKIPHQPNFNSL